MLEGNSPVKCIGILLKLDGSVSQEWCSESTFAPELPLISVRSIIFIILDDIIPPFIVQNIVFQL